MTLHSSAEEFASDYHARQAAKLREREQSLHVERAVELNINWTTSDGWQAQQPCTLYSFALTAEYDGRHPTSHTPSSVQQVSVALRSKPFSFGHFRSAFGAKLF